MEKVSFSPFKTFLALIVLILIYIPTILIAEIIVRFLISWSSIYTYGASDNIIPFDFLPQYGVPIMNFIKETAINFVRVITPLWIISYIFKNSFQIISWKIVCSLFFIFWLYTFITFVPNIAEMNKFVAYATIITIGIFNLISYFILFYNKDSHQEME